MSAVAQTTAKKEVVGPRLRKLLVVVFALSAALAVNSVYLVGIKLMGWAKTRTYEDYFYLWMFAAHLILGLALIVPLVAFAVLHWRTARHHRNRRAVRMGQALFVACLLLIVSGLVLIRLEGVFKLDDPTMRNVAYWLHVFAPLAAVYCYILHRLAGPAIRWRQGMAWAAVAGMLVAGMMLWHAQDPRQWGVKGPKEGFSYFHPSGARTVDARFIPREALMNDGYCKQCHPDVHARWMASAHRGSSFNNKAYLFSVRETRKVLLARHGNVKGSRFCAGCHDPVPFFSGAFDNPNFDDVKDPTAHAGITCTVCHAITNIEDVRGNASYTIEEPLHYPFAFSDNPILKYINRQLILAKPSFHKATFLKPLHKSAEFCGTCHKVHLPPELNDYKWIRGQNHYDTFLLSGVSGHGAQSFYYPPAAKENCNECHMPLQASNDFAAKKYLGVEKRSIHDHLFPSANTALPHWNKQPEIVKEHQKFLKDVLRVDLFALREGEKLTGKQHVLRPDLPTLKAGEKYVLEVVTRTLKLGHHFTQGTTDSNEVWLEIKVNDGQRLIAASGQLDGDGRVDPWSFFFNVYMLDRHGNRIDRRNAQDIFVPLYNHQIPPGAARVARFALNLPSDTRGPVTVDAAVKYRKFDYTYLRHVFGPGYQNDLPITTICSDKVTLGVEGGETPTAQQSLIEPWQRWNDYGIGLLLEKEEGKVADLNQALRAFQEVEKLGRADGLVNQARVLIENGDLPQAATVLEKATKANPPPPSWTVLWLSARVNRGFSKFDEAIEQLEAVHGTRDPQRGFDFSKDYRIINDLGELYFHKAKSAKGRHDEAEQRQVLLEAEIRYKKTLELDPENATAHLNLSFIYHELKDHVREKEHLDLHNKYQVDQNNRDFALSAARAKDPAANHASNTGAIHPLHTWPVEKAASKFVAPSK